MSGDVTVKGISGDLDVGFDKILDHLKFGAMGSTRMGYGRWAISTEVIYMDLEGSKGPFTGKAQQWLVQPALEYRLNQYVGLYAGTRYNNIRLELDGPGGINPAGTHEWWDPVLGTRLRVPLWRKLSFNVNGDVGGFEWVAVDLAGLPLFQLAAFETRVRAGGLPPALHRLRDRERPQPVRIRRADPGAADRVHP